MFSNGWRHLHEYATNKSHIDSMTLKNKDSGRGSFGDGKGGLGGVKGGGVEVHLLEFSSGISQCSFSPLYPAFPCHQPYPVILLHTKRRF